MLHRLLLFSATFLLVLVACSGSKSEELSLDTIGCDSRGRSLLQQHGQLVVSDVTDAGAGHLRRQEDGELLVFDSRDVGEGSVLRSAVSSKNLLTCMFGSNNSDGRKLHFDSIASALRHHDGVLSVSHMNELLNSNQNPKGMKRYITENLLPQAEQATREMQHEIDSATQTVNNCSAWMWTAEKEMRHREEILNQDDSEAMRCIARENELVQIQKEACDMVTSKVSQTVDIMNMTELPEKTAEAVESALKQQLHFYSSALPDLRHLMSACGNATKDLNQQTELCNSDKKIVKEVYCRMKEKRDETCAEYSKCFAEKSGQYEIVKQHVKETEKYNKDHFQNMACASFVKGSSACEGNMTDVTHLDVTYQALPEKKTCAPIMWAKLDHSEVNCSDAADDLGFDSEPLDIEMSTTLGPMPGNETSAAVAPDKNETSSVTRTTADTEASINTTVATSTTAAPVGTDTTETATHEGPAEETNVDVKWWTTVAPDGGSAEETVKWWTTVAPAQVEQTATTPGVVVAHPISTTPGVVVDFDELLATTPPPEDDAGV